MKCPHCLENYHAKPKAHSLHQDEEREFVVESETCPACGKVNLQLLDVDLVGRLRGPNGMIIHGRPTVRSLIYPKASIRKPPAEVPDDIAEDFTQASLVLDDSPKASAALSRRCLQHVLRSVAGVKHGNLVNEIQEVLDKKSLPSHLADGIDAVRIIGNFAAHPSKSTNTGEIVEVEPGEAEWSLDILEGLFDFYYVQPAILKARRDALNAKLSEAGRQPMK